MKLKLIIGLSALAVASAANAQSIAPPPVDSRPLANELGRCMVAKTTGEDRLNVAGWMLAGIASAPQLADVVTVAPGKKDQFDRAVAALLVRLWTVDCQNQAKALFSTHDSAAFQLAGRPLGEIAVAELLSNPAAKAAMSNFTKYIDENAMKQLVP